MKTTTFVLLALAAVASLSSCIHVVREEPVTRTVTTERTTVVRAPVVETRTVRTY